MSDTEIPYKFLVNASPPERGNVTASVTAALRHAIVTLDLKPGEIEPVRRRVLIDQLGPRIARELGLTLNSEEEKARRQRHRTDRAKAETEDDR